MCHGVVWCLQRQDCTQIHQAEGECAQLHQEEAGTVPMRKAAVFKDWPCPSPPSITSMWYNNDNNTQKFRNYGEVVMGGI